MENKIIFKELKEFSISQIADSGQAFRWNINEDGSYTGVVFNKLVNVRQESGETIITYSGKEDCKDTWENYFDLKRDYSEVIEDLKGKDKNLDKAILFGKGIRILNQDLWEMIISFIISGNNNIPRIKNSIETISEKYGDFIEEYNGKRYYSFPTPEQLSSATIEDLRKCGVGYRDSYIFKTTKAIVEKEIDLDLIKNTDIGSARKELKKLTGVGDKVADCILLFSCGKTNAFPVDTWVKKILLEYYNFQKTNLKDVNKFVNEYFGEYCGIAQQYLFYYIRSLA